MRVNGFESLSAAALLAVLAACGGQVSEQAVATRVSEVYGQVAEVYAVKPDKRLLDSLFCSNDWQMLNAIISEMDAGSKEEGFFDADYWVMGQDWHDLSVDSVTVDMLAEHEAQASLNLHSLGQTTRVGLSLVLENEEWRIDDFIDMTNNFDWKAHMNDYVETAAIRLNTDSVGLVREDADVEVRLSTDYPVDGATAVLVDSVRNYIAQTLRGDLLLMEQPERLLESACQTVYDDLKAVRDELSGDESGLPPFYVYCEMKKHTDTRKYVTYLTTYDENQDGVQGSSRVSGVTFDKSTGRRMGWDMLRDTGRREFRLLLKEGVRQFFRSVGIEADSDGMLADLVYANEDVNRLPLPACPPYLTEAGMVFCYQQYELTDCTAGQPVFTLSYDQLAPYLTEAGAALVKEK